MFLFWIVAVSLAVASLIDGITTVQFLKKGVAESGARWVFGSHPSVRKVYGLGGVIIAAEILALLVVFHVPVVALHYLFSAGLLVQVGLHIRGIIINLRLK